MHNDLDNSTAGPHSNNNMDSNRGLTLTSNNADNKNIRGNLGFHKHDEILFVLVINLILTLKRDL